VKSLVLPRGEVWRRGKGGNRCIRSLSRRGGQCPDLPPEELKQPVPPAQITLVIRPNEQDRCLFIQPGPFLWPSQPASLGVLPPTVGFDRTGVGTVVMTADKIGPVVGRGVLQGDVAWRGQRCGVLERAEGSVSEKEGKEERDGGLGMASVLYHQGAGKAWG
jgi:hypothetical protein